MKKILFTITLAVTSFTLYANPGGNNLLPPLQKEKARSGFDPARLVYGGQLGMGFGSNDYWSIYVSPQVGYRITDRFTAGAGISYAYTQEKYYWAYEYKIKQHQFGFNLFTDYYITKRFFVSARPEIFYQRLTWEVYNDRGRPQNIKEDDFIPAVVLGIGMSFGPVMLSLNYDIVQDDWTPYGDSVFVSVGVRF